jgi:adenylosuccinate lyase
MRCWAGEGDFLDLLAGTPEVAANIPREELARFFDPKLFLTHVDAIYARVFG